MAGIPGHGCKWLEMDALVGNDGAWLLMDIDGY